MSDLEAVDAYIAQQEDASGLVEVIREAFPQSWLDELQHVSDGQIHRRDRVVINAGIAEIERLRVELVDTRTKLAEAQKQLAKYGEPDIEYGEEWPIKGDITRGSQLHATHSRLVRRTPWAVLGD